MKTARSIFLLLLLLHNYSTFLLAAELVQPGDKVRLRIIGVLDKLYDVGEDGNIDFDLWGKVNLMNKDRDEAVTTIRTALSKYIRFEQRRIFLSIKKKPVKRHQAYISVFGEVRSPGSYQARDNFKVLDYIVLSGGTTRFALTDSIKVICSRKGAMKAVDFNMQRFSAGEATPLPTVGPGCMIYVPEKPAEKASWLRNRPEQVIHVLGQVTKPGRYEFDEEFGFMDILSHVGGAKDEANLTRIAIISHERVRFFNLKAYLHGGGDLPHLHTGDVIFFSKEIKSDEKFWTRIRSDQSIYLIGEFKRPGRYKFDSGLNFMDALAQAGGPTEKGNTKKIAIIRDNEKLGEFDLYAFQNNHGPPPPILLPEDMIVISPRDPEKWIRQDPKVMINIMGEVVNPGRYEVEPNNLNFIDLLASANGPSSNADLGEIRIMHRNSYPLDGKGVEEESVSVFDFEAYQESGDPSLLPTIRLGDTIFVPPQKTSFWEEFKTIGGTLGVVAVALAFR